MIMGWTLLAPATERSGPKTFQLPYDSPRSLVLTQLGGYKSLGIVGQLLPEVHTEVGQITLGKWGVKLEAVNDTLSIRPGSVAAVALLPEKYELNPRLGERSEVILLRQGDIISSSNSTASLILQWYGPEVQVNSSAAEPVETTETPEEDETEGEDGSTPVVAVSATQAKSQQSWTTPGLSNPQGLIVQETPTAARFIAGAEFSLVQKAEGRPSRSLDATPLQSFTDQADEAFSTAHTGESQGRMSTTHPNPDHNPSSRRSSDVLPNESASVVSDDESENT